MTIFNREDFHTALPQIEKRIVELEKSTTYKKIPIEPHQCTVGAASSCYKIGNIVILSINIQVTTATANYSYLTGLPKPIERVACTTSTNSTPFRWHILESGELNSATAPATGWHNGSVVYLTKEK